MKPGDMVRLSTNLYDVRLKNDDSPSFLFLRGGEVAIVIDKKKDHSHPPHRSTLLRIVTSEGNSGWIESYNLERVKT